MIVNGTTTFADAFRGFEAMEQFAEGASFNTLNYPSTDAPHYSYYVAWWSPGQWVLPYFLKYVFHIGSIQVIQTLLIFFALCGSIYGYYRLFLRLGFTSATVFLSIIMIVTNQLFYWHTLIYYGGDLFLLLITPYFLLLLLRFNKMADLRSFLLLFIFCAVGIFFKNTFILYMAAAGIFLLVSPKHDGRSSKVMQLVSYAISSIILLFITYYFHISRGETPGSAIDHEGYNGIPNNLIGDLSYPLGSAVGIFTRISFFIQKAFHGSGPTGNILQIIPLAVIVLYLLDHVIKKWDEHSRLIVLFCIPFLGFFSVFFLMDKAISYELRHFAPIAFLFFPGLIDWMFFRLKRSVTYLLILTFCTVDVGLFGMSVINLSKNQTMWHDLKVSKKDAELFKVIEKWDSEHSKGLVIIEEYWLPVIAVRNNDKLVIKKQDGSLFVVSGMELSNPDRCALTDSDLSKFSSVLFILHKKGNIKIPDWLKKERGTNIPSGNKDFMILEINTH